MKSEFTGDILCIRDVEDCIRATRKYTKGLFRRSSRHPIQGDTFPSKVLTEYYEVYPGVELGWDMSAGLAWSWVWGDERHIDVMFKYDYRNDAASMIVQDGPAAVKELARSIPGFSDSLARVNGE